jgi:hypothetical protein
MHVAPMYVYELYCIYIIVSIDGRNLPGQRSDSVGTNIVREQGEMTLCSLPSHKTQLMSFPWETRPLAAAVVVVGVHCP